MWIKLSILSWEASKWTSALAQQELSWGSTGCSGPKASLPLTPSRQAGRRRLMGGPSYPRAWLSRRTAGVPVMHSIVLMAFLEGGMSEVETAMETSKHWGQIPSAESLQGNHLLRPQGCQKLYHVYPLKEVNFVPGNNEITDESGQVLWNLILSPPLCLVTIPLISCNVVFWAPFRYCFLIASSLKA